MRSAIAAPQPEKNLAEVHAELAHRPRDRRRLPTDEATNGESGERR